INRVAAWAIGTRNLLKALLIALLEPTDTLRQMEQEGDFTGRLALLEDLKSMPYGAVWDAHCLQQGVPPDLNWMQEVCRYEEDILAKRI
ncbi:MAG: L-rhamnose isomerase, partial [Shimia sp.]|nr:L-rhamnose isomerase [Shimia sp.]